MNLLEFRAFKYAGRQFGNSVGNIDFCEPRTCKSVGSVFSDIDFTVNLFQVSTIVESAFAYFEINGVVYAIYAMEIDLSVERIIFNSPKG